MNILALDMATVTGWATLIDGRIESGVQDFTKKRGESNGMLFMRFTGWLYALGFDFAGKSRFDLVVYERAHHRGGAATELCVGLMTRAQEFATRIGAEYMAVHTATLKKYATGKGNAGKPEMVSWAAAKVNRFITDDNESDAIALLYYAMDELGVTV